MDDLQETPMKVLNQVLKVGKQAGLRYVYLGNVDAENNIYCYRCNKLHTSTSNFYLS